MAHSERTYTSTMRKVSGHSRVASASVRSALESSAGCGCLGWSAVAPPTSAASARRRSPTPPMAPGPSRRAGCLVAWLCGPRTQTCQKPARGVGQICSRQVNLASTLGGGGPLRARAALLPSRHVSEHPFACLGLRRVRGGIDGRPRDPTPGRSSSLLRPVFPPGCRLLSPCMTPSPRID